MAESLEAWLDRHASREEAHAQQALSTAKMVTTFAAATAATFVATALQVGGKPSGWDKGALLAMALASVLVVVIVCHKRKSTSCVNDMAFEAPNQEPPPGDTNLNEFRTKVRRSAKTTKKRADRVFWLMVSQIGLCVVAGALAVVDVHLHAACV